MKTRVLPAIPLVVAATVATASPAHTQNMTQMACPVIYGFGNIADMGRGTAQCTDGRTMITLDGSAELDTPYPSVVQISCWICEQGSCDESSPYGPVVVRQDYPESGPLQLSWRADFNFVDGFEQLPGFPTFQSYYCSLALEAGSTEEFGPLSQPMQPTLPDPFAPDIRARPDETQPFTVILQGTFVEPIEPTRRRPGG